MVRTWKSQQMHIFIVRNFATVHFIDHKPFFDNVIKFEGKMDLIVTVSVKNFRNYNNVILTWEFCSVNIRSVLQSRETVLGQKQNLLEIHLFFPYTTTSKSTFAYIAYKVFYYCETTFAQKWDIQNSLLKMYHTYLYSKS